jgi:two-component sensor histidine kinase
MDVLKESQGRVRSMAMIHEKLYQSTDLSHLNFKEYIEKLVSDILYSHGVKEGVIEPIIQVDNVEMSLETAIPCGLISTNW